MIPPFDYFEHRAACKRKQNERASRIAALPPTYQYPLTANERSILDAPIAQLVQDVQGSATSAVDVLRTYGKVAIKAQEATNCVTEIMFPDAEQWIANGEVNLKGPLAGLPVSLKDSIHVRGFDTSVGYSCNVGKPVEEDGPMVKMLKDAGAVPFVKTALPVTLLSFESFNDVWGRALNPHNSKYSPGGSTGGEGAILAFGGSRIGIGSDVAGSVRAPAHYSGCFSLRCSTGRWPKLGNNTSMPGQEGIPSVFSPMTRTMMDLTYFTRSFIQMKPWTYDPSVHPMPWRQDTYDEFKDSSKKLKIGIMRTDNVVDPAPACARALTMATEALKAQGHEVFDVSLPDPYEALVIASNLLNSDGTKTFRSFFRTGESDDAGAKAFGRYMRTPRFLKYFYYLYVKYIKRDAVWAGLLEHWHPKSAAEQWAWVMKREVYKAKFFDWWNSFTSPEEKIADTGKPIPGAGLDIILTPPNATPAVPHNGMKDAAAACGYTFLWNLLDYTAGIVPVTHVDAKADALSEQAQKDVKKMNGVARGAYKHYDAVAMEGLPVAVQVVGRRLQEEKVLAVMELLEDALEARGEKYQLLPVP
ncbi:amidase signature enzyme [Polychaeton citri CBS 116435]|uniref:amidase n=1 Tax=Polychaeton citri CBS 116435 TaxID=1314669 RepID=A0A9P4UPK4_9PEZI|nr:amidase signature enzyme [Polychaeton citri CBS 116435]